MAKSTFGPPVFTLSPGEAADLRVKASQHPVFDADTQDFLDSPFGPTLIGARNTLTGAAGWRLGMFADYVKGVVEGVDPPLNLTTPKDKLDPLTAHISNFLDNNPDTISQEIQQVPFEELPWLLSSSSHREYKNRLQFLKAGLPEMQEQGSTAAKVVYNIADIVGLTAAGMAAEPLVLARLNVAGMAGSAVSSSTGRYAFFNDLAPAVADAIKNVSRINMAGRYAALGVGESVAYHLARRAVDPTHSPTYGQLAFDLTLAGTLSGGVGGLAFGKRYVRNAVNEAAEGLRREETAVVKGMNGETYTIRYGSPFAFNSPVHADTVLFAAGRGTFDWEAGQVGSALWHDFAETGDLFIPGSRTTGDVHILGGTFPSGRVGKGGVITHFPPYDEAAHARAPDSPSRLGVPYENPADRTWKSPLIGINQFSTTAHLGFDNVSGLEALLTTEVPAGIPTSAATEGAMRVAENRTQLAAREWLKDTTVVRAGEVGFESASAIPGSAGAAQFERQRIQYSLKDVGLIGPTVFRETGSSSAISLIERAEQGLRRHAPFFVSDNIDLALSQGERGVIIEFDAGLINGNLNRAKNLSYQSISGGGREFQISKTAVGSIKSVTLADERLISKFESKFGNVFDFANPIQTERGIKFLRKPGARTTAIAGPGEEALSLIHI